jgi:hypothetical protein
MLLLLLLPMLLEVAVVALLWVPVSVVLLTSGDGRWLRAWKMAATPVACGLVSSATAAAAVPAAWSGGAAVAGLLLLLGSMCSSCM